MRREDRRIAVSADGRASVFKFAVKVLDEVARETLALCGLTPLDVDWLIPHQANVRILEATARKLGIDLSKLVVTVDRHGNTSAASVPLALDVAIRDGRIKPGHKVMLQGLGRVHLGRVAGGDVAHVKFAMVFQPGIAVGGMLAGYGDMPAIRETLAEASEVLKQDLARLIAEGPAEELNSTVNTQPVM